MNVGNNFVPPPYDGSFLASGALMIIVGILSLGVILLGITGMILLNRGVLATVSAVDYI